MKKISILTAVVIAAVLVVLSLVVRYDVRNGAAGDLLWNDDQADFFLSVGSTGYRTSYLHYFASLIGGFFGTIPTPTTKRASLVVLQVTSQGVHRYDVDETMIGSYETIHGFVYGLRRGVVVKWIGDHFELPDDADAKLFGTGQASSGPDFTNIDTWSKRCCLFSRSAQSRFDINQGGKPLALQVERDLDSQILRIVLITPDGTSRTVWSLDERSRKVSRAEYERTFEKR